MALASNSLVSFTHGSLSQPGTGRPSQLHPSPSLSLYGSPSLSLKLTHRSNSALLCSVNVSDRTSNNTPSEKGKFFLFIILVPVSLFLKSLCSNEIWVCLFFSWLFQSCQLILPWIPPLKKVKKKKKNSLLLSHCSNIHVLMIPGFVDLFLIVSGFPAYPTVMNIDKIRSILPHRWIKLSSIGLLFLTFLFACSVMIFLFLFFGVIGFHFC